MSTMNTTVLCVEDISQKEACLVSMANTTHPTNMSIQLLHVCNSSILVHGVEDAFQSGLLHEETQAVCDSVCSSVP